MWFGFDILYFLHSLQSEIFWTPLSMKKDEQNVSFHELPESISYKVLGIKYESPVFEEMVLVGTKDGIDTVFLLKINR